MTFYTPGINNGYADTETANIGSFRESATEATLATALTISTHDGTTLSESMRITGSGKVGIGSNAPASLLANSATNTLDAFSQGINLNYGMNWVVPSTAAVGYVASFTNLRTTSNSNGVLISSSDTSTGSRLLEVEGSGSSRFMVRGDGNVGIGTTAPGGKVEINSGAANATTGLIINTSTVGANTYASFKANGTVIGSISSPAAGTSVAYNTTSDIRLKGGFHHVDHALEKISGIEVSNFYYLADPNHRMDGFKAQQLYTVLPYAVTKPEKETDEDGHIIPWLADYSKVVPLVTAAVKELYQKVIGQDEKIVQQSREIASLKNENATIKNENAAIKARLDRQEKEMQIIKKKLGL
jgi:hypothetical protein